MPLRITVELIPHGNELLTRKLGIMYITNTGFGSKDSVDYKIIEMIEGEELPDAYKLSAVPRDMTNVFNFLGNLFNKRRK